MKKLVLLLALTLFVGIALYSISIDQDCLNGINAIFGTSFSVDGFYGYRERQLPLPPGYSVIVNGPETSEQMPHKTLVHPPEWYRQRYDAIRKSIAEFASGGYEFDRSLANSTLAKLKSLDNALSCGDTASAERWSLAAHADYDKFRESCRWQIGVRHPRHSHVISLSTPGQWGAEDGWEFIDQSKGFAVRKKQVQRRESSVFQPMAMPQPVEQQIRCRACSGRGTKEVWTTCPMCNGHRKVVDQQRTAQSAVSGMANAFARGKRPRRPPQQRTYYMSCPTCGGKGRIPHHEGCGQCGGNGFLIKR